MAAGAAATENGTGDGSLQRANRPAQWHSGEPGKAEASYGSGMAGRKGMEVPSVEQTIETPGNRQSPSTDPGLPNVGSSGYHPSVPTSSHCHEVLLHETHDGNNELPSHLQIGLVSSEPQRDHYVGHAQDAPGQHGVSVSGDGVQNGKSRPKSCGTEDHGHALWPPGLNTHYL